MNRLPILVVLLLLAQAQPGQAAQSGFFLVEYLPGEGFNPAISYRNQPGLRAHHAYLRKLHVNDQLVMGGAASGDAVSVVLIRTATREEAEALINNDPAVATNQLRANVIDWSVDLSSMRFMPRQPMQPIADPDAPVRLRRIDSDSAINLEDRAGDGQ